MSLLVVGLSHHSAPVEILERVTPGPETATKLLDDVAAATHVTEAMLLATCNRVELYTEVDRFHGGLSDVSELLARHAGMALEELTPYLYVHFDDRAARHLFSVACGLDSMLVGERQILGQVRGAFRTAQERGEAGRALHECVQAALRAGKRAHSETAIGSTGTTLVGVGMSKAADVLGSLHGRRALVLGAGAMGSVAVAALVDAGLGEVTVANRSLPRAERLAERVGGASTGRAVSLTRLDDELVAADLIVACTASQEVVVGAQALQRAMARRERRPIVLLDLAIPRDIEPAAAELPGVTVVDLDTLRPSLEGTRRERDIADVRRIVDDEFAAYSDAVLSTVVAPTVVALRDMAAEVVSAELARLDRRLPELDERARGEMATTVRRVVDKLLHSPTVRVRELARTEGPDSYAEALSRLFDLDLPSPVELPEGPASEAGR